MYQYSDEKDYPFQNPNVKIAVGRVTALWAFSEAALGGILHALKIPFTGLFIGGAAVVFISLIAYLSNNHRAILKSTLIVIVVKAIVSPYTPVNAYFAVALQGVIGFLLFFNNNNYKLKAIFLGLITSILSGFQKIIILTIVFGNTLWDSIDLFADYIISLIGFMHFSDDSFSLSAILITSYILLHFAGGITFGIFAAKVPGWLVKKSNDENYLNKISLKKDYELKSKKRVKRVWWKRKSGIAIFAFSFGMIILTYLIPDLDENLILKIVIMLLRSIFVMIFWTFIISPFILKYFNKFVKKRRSEYSEEIDGIIFLFPYFKARLKTIMREAKEYSGLEKIKYIFSNSFYSLLTGDIKN